MSSKKAKKDADNLSAVLNKIPEMFGPHASIGERLHEIIIETLRRISSHDCGMACPVTPRADQFWSSSAWTNT